MIFFAKDVISVFVEKFAYNFGKIFVVFICGGFKPCFFLRRHTGSDSFVFSVLLLGFWRHVRDIIKISNSQQFRVEYIAICMVQLIAIKVVYGDYGMNTNGVQRLRSQNEKACNDVPYTRPVGFFSLRASKMSG